MTNVDVKLDVNIFDLDLASVNLNIELLKKLKSFLDLEIRFLPSFTLITPSLSPIEQHSDSVLNLYPISP